MDKKEINLTENDFDYFKKTCQKWIDKLGMTGWSVLYEFCELNDVMATASFNIVGRIATLRLNTSWPESQYSIDRIRRSAFHEVMELLLGRLRCIGQYKLSRDDEFDEEVHNLIRIFENVFFPVFDSIVIEKEDQQSDKFSIEAISSAAADTSGEIITGGTSFATAVLSSAMSSSTDDENIVFDDKEIKYLQEDITIMHKLISYHSNKERDAVLNDDEDLRIYHLNRKEQIIKIFHLIKEQNELI